MATGARFRSIGTTTRAAALGTALALVLGAASATAQEKDGSPQAPSLVEPNRMTDQDEEARALYKAGVIAFDAGRFRNALDAFQRAYELSQRPELLYNVGSVADRLRLDAVALDAFERYLHAVPDTPHAASVEARIEVLRKAVEKQREAQAQRAAEQGEQPMEEMANEELEEPEPMPPPPAPQEPSWPKWTLIGAGGGATVAGVVVLAMGQRNRSQIESAEVGSSFADVSKYENADALTGAGAAIAGVGLAAALAGTLWLVMDGKADRQLALGVAPGGIAIGGSL